MGRGSGSIRPHLAVLLLLTGVLAGLLLRTPVPSVPTPLPQGEVGERIAAALPAELSPLRLCGSSLPESPVPAPGYKTLSPRAPVSPQ